MAVSSVWRLSYLCHSGVYHYHQKVKPPNTSLFLRNPTLLHFTTSMRRSCVVRRAGGQNSTNSSQEDLWYVGKLVVGSFAGAGVIKYGSALFPEITTPNIVLALIIISTPLLVAVVLLIKESLPKP